MFIGRKEELAKITEKLNNNRFEAMLIYGKKDLGKSCLVKEALSNVNNARVLFYMFRDTTYEKNIEEFSSYIVEKFNLKFVHLTSLKEIM